MKAEALSILLLTEDSGKDAHSTAEALVRAMLPLVDPACDGECVRIEPVPEEAIRKVSQASYWKSEAEEHRNDIRQLCARIAAQLVKRGPDGFVLYHIDGDRAWSQRASADNPVLFQKRIVKKVRAILETRKRLTGTELEGALRRLFLVMPFYSIESWLYQNGREAIAILNEEHGGSHVHLFEQWQLDRTLLDEVDQPKGRDVTPLADRYNRRLAERDYPAGAVAEAGRSLSQCVASLRASSALREALGRTR